MNRLLHRGADRRLWLLSALMLASACISVGPGTQKIAKAGQSQSIRGIQVINLDAQAIQRLQSPAAPDFATALGYSAPVGEVVGAGDVLDVSIIEAPPAVLFSTNPIPTSADTSRSTSLPEFLIGPSGRIEVPFAGSIQAAGRSLSQIQADIVARLRGKAHQPQVSVRLLRNMTANVAVLGEVERSTRMPLTAKGETVLDALAAAGGTKQLASKTTIQISRAGQVYMMPLDMVIRDPRQNIILRPGDVVTALFQPYSFTALGAAGRNDEINFEATGLTLGQAMGRVAGLQDGRADAKGVFLFRWEDPALFPDRGPGVGTGPDGRIPVIYRVDMKDPATYLAMQHFRMKDKDVIYISSNPIVEFQRVIGIVASAVFPIINVDNALNN